MCICDACCPAGDALLFRCRAGVQFFTGAPHAFDGMIGALYWSGWPGTTSNASCWFSFDLHEFKTSKREVKTVYLTVNAWKALVTVRAGERKLSPMHDLCHLLAAFLRCCLTGRVA